MKALVIEDELDLQFLIQAVLSRDPRFAVPAFAVSAEDGLEAVRSMELGIIVLDHGLTGELTGIDAAPRFKAVAPQAKIILFTAHAELAGRAGEEPAIDAFLLKTEVRQLLPLAQRLTGLGPNPG